MSSTKEVVRIGINHPGNSLTLTLNETKAIEDLMDLYPVPADATEEEMQSWASDMRDYVMAKTANWTGLADLGSSSEVEKCLQRRIMLTLSAYHRLATKFSSAESIRIIQKSDASNSLTLTLTET